jgi:hypothetical protein
MEQLKKLAVDYLHPENPVVTTDSFAMGRNYFTRPSAEEYEDDVEERNQILEDMKQLKQLAVDYLHPETPVVTSDVFATGRNYFTRPSAEEYEDEEDAEELVQILEDMKQLKQLAIDYQHPENPVKTTDPTAMGRNYFDRASAPGHAEHILSQGQAIEQGYEKAHLVDHGYYQYEDHHDESSESYHLQSDHFEMDEDVYHDFRESFGSVVVPKGSDLIKAIQEEEEGHLSRSPSSVMLFEGEAM